MLNGSVTTHRADARQPIDPAADKSRSGFCKAQSHLQDFQHASQTITKSHAVVAVVANLRPYRLCDWKVARVTSEPPPSQSDRSISPERRSTCCEITTSVSQTPHAETSDAIHRTRRIGTTAPSLENETRHARTRRSRPARKNRVPNFCLRKRCCSWLTIVIPIFAPPLIAWTILAIYTSRVRS